jgi:Holliday junction resolvase RusA-like endonuclease
MKIGSRVFMSTSLDGAESVSVWEPYWPPAPPAAAVALSLRLSRQAVPWKRPKPLRNGKRASFIEGEKLHTFYAEVKLKARRYRGKTEPIKGPVEYRLQCGFPFPKSGELLKLSPVFAISNSCGDFDNLAKGIADALSGVVWSDDRLVVSHHFRKVYSEKPFVLIEVIELDFLGTGFGESCHLFR